MTDDSPTLAPKRPPVTGLVASLAALLLGTVLVAIAAIALNFVVEDADPGDTALPQEVSTP